MLDVKFFTLFMLVIDEWLFDRLCWGVTGEVEVEVEEALYECLVVNDCFVKLFVDENWLEDRRFTIVFVDDCVVLLLPDLSVGGRFVVVVVVVVVDVDDDVVIT